MQTRNFSCFFAVLFVAWILWFGSTGAAIAQPLREVAVVPVGISDARSAIDAASHIEAALADARISVISLHDARDRFTARSRLPQQLPESDLDALSRAAHDASEHVAFGRTAAAHKSVREVLTRAERALESLNRDTATARQILDACLSLVRSALQTGNREQALERGMRCRRLVPDLVPNRTSQPSQVIAVLVEVDDLLARMRVGHLLVQSTPEPRCAVYVNGRHLGTTPFELDRAAAGQYHVQVECGDKPARVHMVQLGDQPATLLVDSDLDRAVVSSPRLVLSYDDRESARVHAVSGAVGLGREIAADDVLLVAIDRGQAELVRVQVRQQRLVGRIALPWSEQRGFDQETLEEAITALAQARVLGTPSFEPMTETVPKTAELLNQTVRPEVPEAKRSADFGEASSERIDRTTASDVPSPNKVSEQRGPRHRRKLALGLSSLAIGAGLFVATGVFAGKRAQAGYNLRSLKDNTGERYNELVSTWEDTRAPMYLLAALGSVTLTSSALGLLLRSPPEAFPSWASWASTAIGLGLATWSAADLARGGACSPNELDRKPCSDDLERLDRGAVLMLAAMPLFAVSLTQLIRRAYQPETMHTVVSPHFDPFRKALALEATVSWF